MNEAEVVATVEVLADLGFKPVADPMPGFIFDFGNFKLRASEELINLQFQDVVYFTGVLATPDVVSEVSFDLPIRLKSRDQCIAMIAYYLDNAAIGREFQPKHKASWINEGRQFKHLLPWVIQRAERELKEAPYRARPCCYVRSDWARFAIKTLANYLEFVNDETPILFFFQNSVLKIRCNSELIAMADGSDKTASRKLAAL